MLIRTGYDLGPIWQYGCSGQDRRSSMFHCWAPTLSWFGSSLHYFNNDLTVITYITPCCNYYTLMPVMLIHVPWNIPPEQNKQTSKQKNPPNGQTLGLLATHYVSVTVYLCMNPSDISANIISWNGLTQQTLGRQPMQTNLTKACLLGILLLAPKVLRAITKDLPACSLVWINVTTVILMGYSEVTTNTSQFPRRRKPTNLRPRFHLQETFNSS